MRQVYDKYFCDMCGCEIERTPFDSMCGKSVKIRDGIIARPVEMDVCDDCFAKMKEICMKKGETDGR